MDRMLKSFAIEDDLEAQNSGAIEVTLHLENGSSRWCFFITPAALEACGDWISETHIRVHYGAAHMIVVAGQLNRALIEKALQQIDRAGELEKCSLPVGKSSA